MPDNSFLLAEGVDQSTPRADAEKLNSTRYDTSFLESAGNAALASGAATWQLGMAIGGALGSTDAQELADIFKEYKDRKSQLASNYDGRTFLGQTAPEWTGGIIGSITNPLNLVPWGKAVKGASTMVQSVLTNTTGALVDAGVRTALEDRLHEEVTFNDVVMNMGASTILGSGLDYLQMKLKKKPVSGVIEEEIPPNPKSEMDVAKESVVEATAMTRFENGVPSEFNKVKEAFEPAPIKKLTAYHDANLGESVIVVHDDGSISFENAYLQGVQKVERMDTTSYKVGGLEFDTLEAANAHANNVGAKVVMTDINGKEHVLDPVMNEKINAEKMGGLQSEAMDETKASGFDKADIDEFTNFVDNSTEGEHLTRLEKEFQTIKESIDEEIKAQENPPEELLKRQEEMNMADSNNKTEESVIKALTSCALRNLK